MKFDIDEFVDLFIRKCFSPFSAADLQKAAGKNVSLKSVEEVLNCHPHVYHFGKDKYISRPGFFSGKTFTIAPLSSEIHAGILIIGHRGIPFVDPELIPCDLEFWYNDEIVPKKTSQVKTQEAFERYALFGAEYAEQFFFIDLPSSECSYSGIDSALPSIINITVFDMAALYKRWNFKAGDRLAAKVINWDSGFIEINPVFSTENREAIGGSEDEKRREWFELFEKSLLSSFAILGPGESINEQLTYAFLIGGDDLFSAEGASPEEFLRYSEKIGFEVYGVETRLWKTGEEIPVFGLDENSENLRALDFFFSGADSPVAEVMLDAFLYDSLYKKENTIEPLAKRIVPSESIVSKKQAENFLLHLNSRRVILKRAYNWFADYQKGQLRSQTLEFYSQVLEFVCSLEEANVSLKKLPQQPLIVLMQLHSHILYILEAVMPEETPAEKDFSSMYLSLEGMTESFEDLKEILEDALEENSKQRFSVIKKNL